MTWLRAHWKLVLLVSHLVVAGGAALAGRFTAPRPKVELHQELDLSQAQASKEDREAVYGALDAHIVVGASPCAPAPGTAPQPGQVRPALRRPPQTIAEAIASLPPGSSVDLHQEPSSEASHASAQSSSQERARTDLTVTPQTLPWRAIGFRFDDPFGDKRLRIEAGVRVFGTPVWVRPGWKPADGLVKGWSLGADVQW